MLLKATIELPPAHWLCSDAVAHNTDNRGICWEANVVRGEGVKGLQNIGAAFWSHRASRRAAAASRCVKQTLTAKAAGGPAGAVRETSMTTKVAAAQQTMALLAKPDIQTGSGAAPKEGGGGSMMA